MKRFLFALLALVALQAFSLAQSPITHVVHLMSDAGGVLPSDGTSFDIPCAPWTPSRVRIRALSGHEWQWGVENLGDVATGYNGSGSCVEVWQHAGVGGMQGVVYIPSTSGSYFGGPTLAPFDGELDYAGPSAHDADSTYWHRWNVDSLGAPALWCASNSPSTGMHRITLASSFAQSMHANSPGVDDSALSFYARGVWHLPTVAVTYFP